MSTKQTEILDHKVLRGFIKLSKNLRDSALEISRGGTDKVHVEINAKERDKLYSLQRRVDAALVDYLYLRDELDTI